MNQEDVIAIHSLIDRDDPKSMIVACNFAAEVVDSPHRVTTYKDAYIGLYALLQGLLDDDLYTEAALLCWGTPASGKGGIFDPRPKSVQRIWHALMTEPKVLIPGGGSQGKSFTPAAWCVLNWIRDPRYTSGKIISVTESHAAANVMATIKSFHENSAIPLVGRRMDKGIRLTDGDLRAAIWMMALPAGEDIKGRLRGFHPVLRPKPHPKFGRKTRLFAMIDEGEDAAVGVWEGIENMLSTEGVRGEVNLITIVSGTNPKKIESPYAQRAQFPNGWEHFDIEKDEEWYGPEKFGRWKVVRIDPAKSENVVEGKEIYPGMMTKEGYMNYYRMGAKAPAYLTFGRGAWPTEQAEFYITFRSFFNEAVGMFTFAGKPHNWASYDPSFALGGDKPMVTTGKFGEVIGFQPLHGAYMLFPRSFNAIQIEQQFTLKKDNQVIMADEMIRYLRVLGVRPEWFIIDKTGTGAGIHDIIRYKYGDIVGQNWAEASTDRKILQEDTQFASDRYKGVHTEMMFAFSQWLQFGFIKFAPIVDISKLKDQACGRTFFYEGKGLMQAQTKEDYKAISGGISPDEYDSAIMSVHLVRARAIHNAAMLPDQPSVAQQQYGSYGSGGRAGGVVDKIEFYET